MPEPLPTCPSCGAPVSIESSLLGKPATCPACQADALGEPAQKRSLRTGRRKRASEEFEDLSDSPKPTTPSPEYSIPDTAVDDERGLDSLTAARDAPRRKRIFWQKDDRLFWDEGKSDPRAARVETTTDKPASGTSNRKFYLCLSAIAIVVLGFELVSGIAWRTVSTEKPVPLVIQDASIQPIEPKIETPLEDKSKLAIESMKRFLDAKNILSEISILLKNANQHCLTLNF